MNKIRVAMVEDDLDWLKAMISFLEKHEDIVIVGKATTRNECMELVKSEEIDVLLMDINLNGNECDGIYAVVDILEITKMKIIMLTSLRNEEIIKDSFIAGAINYVLKENYEEIPMLIRKCHRESTPIEILVKEFTKLKREEQLKELSPSEKEIFSYLEKGYTYSQIEKALYKTRNTVKSQIRSILSKLNVKTYKDAIVKVNSRGLKSNRG